MHYTHSFLNMVNLDTCNVNLGSIFLLPNPSVSFTTDVESNHQLDHGQQNEGDIDDHIGLHGGEVVDSSENRALVDEHVAHESGDDQRNSSRDTWVWDVERGPTEHDRIVE